MEGSLKGQLGVLTTADLVAMDQRLNRHLKLVYARRVIVKEEIRRRSGTRGNAGRSPGRNNFQGDGDAD